MTSGSADLQAGLRRGKEVALDRAQHVARTGFGVWHGNRNTKPNLVEVEGSWFLVPVHVFNPDMYGSGLFARYLLEHPELIRPEAGGPATRALDLCTGSGVMAVTMARMGAEVVASDINPDAVWATGVNARLNGVENRVDVREGDLWAPLAGERFDLIVTNPPWFSHRNSKVMLLPDDWRVGADEPVPMFERAFYAGPDGGMLIALTAGLAEHLAPGGRVLMQTSASSVAVDPLLEVAREHGLEGRLLTRQLFWPTLTHFPIYSFQGAGSTVSTTTDR